MSSEPYAALSAGSDSGGGVFRAAVAGALGGLVGLLRCIAFGICYATVSGASVGPILMSFFISGLVSQLTYLWWRHPLPGIIAGPSSTAVPFTVSVAKLAAEGVLDAETSALRVLLATSTISLLHAAVCRLARLGARHLDMAKATFPQPVVLGLFGSLGYSLIGDGLKLSAVGPALGAGIGARALMMTRAGKHPLTFPGFILLQAVGFHVLCLFLGVTLEDARSRGWLMKQPSLASVPEYLLTWANLVGGSLSAPGLSHSDLASLAIKIAPLVVSSLPLLLMDVLVCLLLPLEVLTTRSMPCKAELRTAGASSLLCAVLGGQVSYGSLSPTKLTFDAGGGESQVAGLAAALIWATALTPAGPLVIGLCPNFVVAGLIIYTSAGFLLDGFWAPRRLVQHAPLEYMVICLTFLVGVLVSLPSAILFGLMLLSVLFLIRYARGASTIMLAQAMGSELVEQWDDTNRGCALLRSKKYRNPEDWEFLLPRLTAEVFVVRTNVSHLFFASVTPTLAAAPLQPPLRYLILDLTSVVSLDSSALSVLSALPPGIMLLVSGLKAELLAQARALGSNLRSFGTLDGAFEWCEDQILWEKRPRGGSGPKSSLVEQGVLCEGRTIFDAAVPQPLPNSRTEAILVNCFVGASKELLDALLGQLGERRQLSMGAVAFEESQPATSMLVCLSGSLNLYRGLVRMPMVINKTIGLEVSAKQDVGPRGDTVGGAGVGATGRLVRGMGPGDAACEAAIYGPCVHALSGIANSPCELWALSREAVFQLETSNKPLAMQLYRAISSRLAHLRGDTDARRDRSPTS